MSKSPQRQREIALYRYHKALERGDFETTSAILKQAEHDPKLNQMIAELDSALESESEAQTRPSDSPSISLPPSLNGQPPKPNHFQEQTTMTTQSAYWEPTRSADRANRWAVAMGLLVAILVISIVFLFLIPSGSSKQTLVVQQPTLTPAEIAKQYVEELWGKGNQDLMKTLFSADFVDHDPMFVNNGRVIRAKDRNNGAVLINNVLILHTAVPDITVSTEDIIEAGDHIVIRWTFTGTHTQPFLTFPSTGKPITINNTDILRIVDGKIVERWAENELQSFLNAAEVMNVSPSTAEAVTAFARYAYIFRAGEVENLGDAFADEVAFNGKQMALKDFETTLGLEYQASGGVTNIRMISGYQIGNHLSLMVEFDSFGGKTHNKGRVEISTKDGKITSYDYRGA